MSIIVKRIVWTNIIIVAIIYTLTANRYGGASVADAFFATILQLIVNFGIAFILSIIHLITRRSKPSLGKAVKGFWLSIGLVLVISFPTCLAIGEIRPFNLH